MNIMDLKELLKPKLIKIVLFLLLLIISFLIRIFIDSRMTGATRSGFPSITTITSVLPPEYEVESNTNYFNLLINLIFWYLISCLIVWLYEKYKKKITSNLTTCTSTKNL